MENNSEVRSMTLKRWGIVCGALGVGLVLGCSSKTGEGTAVSLAQAGASSVADASTQYQCMLNCGSGGTSGGGAASGAGGFNGTAGNACASQSYKAEAMPVDMYIMFDQSSSMGDPLPDGSNTWWGAAQQAMTSFVNNNKAAGMAVGIQYFPLQGVAPASCTAPYGTPEVELGLLPGNAAALAQSIANHGPSAFTPTAPALQGALNHMKAWGPAHPGRAPVVVFVTDGFPTECDPQQITDIATIAQTAFDTDPKVRTFVVGFNLGQAGANLNQIAKAGGTDTAFLINGGNIGDDFVNHMLSISAAPLQCSFDIPPPKTGMVLDPDLVQVTFMSSATQATEEIVKLNNLGDCSINQNQGWYYDSPSKPTKIMICPGTCARFSAGVVSTASGCKPVIGKTK